jgi:hypothetical protein
MAELLTREEERALRELLAHPTIYRRINRDAVARLFEGFDAIRSALNMPGATSVAEIVEYIGRLQMTLATLGNSDTVKALARGFEDARAGRCKPFEQVEAECEELAQLRAERDAANAKLAAAGYDPSCNCERCNSALASAVDAATADLQHQLAAAKQRIAELTQELDRDVMAAKKSGYEDGKTETARRIQGTASYRAVAELTEQLARGEARERKLQEALTEARRIICDCDAIQCTSPSDRGDCENPENCYFDGLLALIDNALAQSSPSATLEQLIEQKVAERTRKLAAELDCTSARARSAEAIAGIGEFARKSEHTQKRDQFVASQVLRIVIAAFRCAGDMAAVARLEQYGPQLAELDFGKQEAAPDA